MTTSEPDRARAPRRTLTTRRFLLGCTAGLVTTGALWLAFTLAGEPDTAAGALTGGTLMIAVMIAVRWRAQRRDRSPESGFSRALVGAADERDRAISTAALGYVGIAAFLTNAAGLAAVALGADASAVIGAMQLVLIAVLIASNIVLSRRL